MNPALRVLAFVFVIGMIAWLTFDACGPYLGR